MMEGMVKRVFRIAVADRDTVKDHFVEGLIVLRKCAGKIMVGELGYCLFDRFLRQ